MYKYIMLDFECMILHPKLIGGMGSPSLPIPGRSWPVYRYPGESVIKEVLPPILSLIKLFVAIKW